MNNEDADFSRVNWKKENWIEDIVDAEVEDTEELLLEEVSLLVELFLDFKLKGVSPETRLKRSLRVASRKLNGLLATKIIKPIRCHKSSGRV